MISFDSDSPRLGLSQSVGALNLSSVTADSRAVTPGGLYAALPGTQVDGLSFADQAIAAGASALLVPSHAAARFEGRGITVLSSPNVRKSWARLVAATYPKVPEKVAAITGTNGKTSIAHFVRQLLEAVGRPAISVGTLGLKPDGVAELPALTTPDPVSLFRALEAARSRGYQHLVVEASSHGLDQGRLDGLQVDAAAFTNLTRDHLEYHKDFPGYAAAKQRLFSQLLRQDGVALLNADDPVSEQYASVPRRTWRYGIKGRELRLLDCVPTTNGIRLTAELFGERYTMTAPLIGSFQGHNLIASIGLAHALEADIHALIDKVPHLPSVPGRMEVVPTSKSDRTVLVDYAHTPDALKTALISARPHARGRLLTVFGAGGDRDPGKRTLMGGIAAAFADDAIVTDDNPRTEDPAKIRSEILAASPDLREVGDRREAIAAALALLQPGDLLLIAGKGHEDYQEIAGMKHPFDDERVASALAEEVWG